MSHDTRRINVPVATGSAPEKLVAAVAARLGLEPSRIPVLVAVLLAGVVALPTLRFIWHRAKIVNGWEADAIARSIVGGHGYSFPGNQRWLWDKWNGDPNSYFPTAWVDPVYTYILAGAHWLFGPYVYLAMYGFVFLCVGVLLAAAYRLAERFGGPWAGVAAVVVLTSNATLGQSFFSDITNSALSSAIVIVTALIWVRYFEKPTLSRLAYAGLMSGLMVLTCPSMLYFLYLLPVAVVAFHIRRMPRAVGHSVAALSLAALVLTPWAVRNYLTFGEVVLIRNGGGALTWESTVGPAQTFMPDVAMSPVAAPWQSTGPRDAMLKILDKTYRLPMHRYTVESMIAEEELPGHEQMNEAQRDKFLMSRTKEFIWKHPLVIAEMALTKLQVYVMILGVHGLLTAALAIIGAVYWIRDPRSWPLSLMAFSFSGLFVLALAFYGRYRAPIEPVLTVLAVAGAVRLLSAISVKYFRETQAARQNSTAHGAIRTTHEC